MKFWQKKTTLINLMSFNCIRLKIVGKSARLRGRGTGHKREKKRWVSETVKSRVLI